MNDEKKFLVPEAEIVSFASEDIITLSGGTLAGNANWYEDDNHEQF